MRTGYTTLPLHGGHAPRWLFERMAKLAGSITEAIVIEFGTKEFLKRVSDPVWFQSLGCVLGFDWHSSGLTTTTTGAIKEGIKNKMFELGIFVAGGKGKTSLKTPEEIRKIGDITGISPEPLVLASKASAKTDAVLLQDGYNIYHHTFFFDRCGNWAVVQQGMNERKRKARRYHWLSGVFERFDEEPHTGIIAPQKEKMVIDLTSRRSRENKNRIVEILKNESPNKVVLEYKRAIKSLSLPLRHYIVPYKDISEKYLFKILKTTYDRGFEGFEDFYLIRGVGPSTVRALSMLADVVFGAKPSFEDPVVYSYAHGGKDGFPYPVNRNVYDNSINVMENAIKKAKIGKKEELLALWRLSKVFNS